MSASLLKTALTTAVTKAQAPGAVACVGIAGERIMIEAEGLRASVPKNEPATLDTLYDLASLTKVVATAAAVMLLRDDGKLRLDDPVSKYIPLPNFDSLLIRHLITHTTGLPAWKPWYTELQGMVPYLGRISETAAGITPGVRREYSDMGFILLARVVEQASQEAFDAFCMKRIFKPLEMYDTCFQPSEVLRRRCAPTEQCTWRKRLLRGEVHDENAAAIGGVSGHAGLFSTALDLEKFCMALLAGRIVDFKTLKEMTTVGLLPYYPWQGLGWWPDPWAIGANGYLPSRSAFGHTGWTGVSLWMDRETQLYVILLSNTCHPNRDRRNNTELRRIFHHQVAAIFYPRTTNAHTGLDKLLRNEFAEVKGKKLALLTNQSAVDPLGRSVREVFALDPSLQLRYIYSPEHGMNVQAEAGESVDSESGNIPIISLYGARKEPSSEELRNIQLFIIDLPDIGARYYTYMSTMKDCLAACAQHKTPVLVLDRPNPVGSTVLEGPIATTTGSPVCAAPIPIRHGMTLGELALYFKKTFFKSTSLELSVINAENWWADIQAPDCALPWKPPSPNIPDEDTALMYVGTCLFEGLNMNEGRGTDSPFMLFGAPWLEAEDVISVVQQDTLTGCSLRPVLYIPKSIPGRASSPKYQDKLCRGIAISITDRYALRPFTTAVALISAVHKSHQELKWESFFDVLAGGPWLREQIQSGRSARDIVADIAPHLASFDKERPKLYPTLKQRLEP